MAELQVWGENVAGTAIGAAVWNERTVLVTDWSGGRLNAFAVENGEHAPWGDGYLKPEGIAVLGDEAFIAEQGGVLLRQDLNNPGRSAAVELATGLGAPHAVVLGADSTALYVTDHAGGRILAVDPGTGALEVVAEGLDAPLGLLEGPAGEFYVTEQGTGTLARIGPDGSRTVLVDGLTAPFLLSWSSAARNAILVPERSPANRVGLVEVTAAGAVLRRLVGRGITQPSQAIICKDRLVVTGGGRIISLDASRGLVPGVHFELPTGPLWPGAWCDVSIEGGLSGYSREELEISVEPPGLVSLDRHPAAGGAPDRPQVRLLAGAITGDAEVVARERASGEEVGRAALQVGFHTGPLVDGPGIWVDNRTGPPPVPRLLDWRPGVDDSGKMVPRDTNGAVLRHWRVVAVLVDTDDEQWSDAVTAASPAPTIGTARTNWRDVFVGPGGLDAFFEELSGARMGIELVSGGVLGPVNLGGGWSDWHTMSGAEWLQKDEVLDRVVGALQNAPGVTWTEVDVVFLITRSAGGNFVWPRATIGKTFNVTVKDGSGRDVGVKLAKVAMPHDQSATVGFTDVEVSAHELGHTLALRDIYMSRDILTQAMRNRDLGTRELMGNQQGLPHLSARHKLLLGYLDPAHVRSFTLGIPETGVDVDLVPIAAGIPPAGRFSAVELKVAPKLSWFFELRQGTPGALGDTVTFPPGGEIIGYDAENYVDPPIVADARKPIILLVDDGDGQGPLLAPGEDYESVDAANMSDVRRFMLEVISISAGAARVRVSAGPVAQPDPVLRNNNGRDGDYRSPDIEIRNAVTDAASTAAGVASLLRDLPILGEVNRVVAKVRNPGDLDAPDVSVRFQVLPFNTDDPDSGRWTPLPGASGPSVVHDVPARTVDGDFVEFEVEWVPSEDRHYCIQARIDRYVRVPGAAADEPDVDNNLAQSNYHKVFSKPASPATREVTLVEVHNPLEFAVEARLEVNQDSDRYRSFVEHRWVHLRPGETRMVRLEVESKATSIWEAIESHWPDGNTWLRAWLPGPDCAGVTGSGVTLGVATAVESFLEVSEQGPDVTYLRVTGPQEAPPPGEGTVVALLTYADGTTETAVGVVDEIGHVVVPHQPQPGRGVAYFSGAPAYAPVLGWEFELEGD